MNKLIFTESLNSYLLSVRYKRDYVDMNSIKRAGEMFRAAIKMGVCQEAERLVHNANWELNQAYIHVGQHDDFVNQDFPSNKQVAGKFKEIMG